MEELAKWVPQSVLQELAVYGLSVLLAALAVMVATQAVKVTIYNFASRRATHREIQLINVAAAMLATKLTLRPLNPAEILFLVLFSWWLASFLARHGMNLLKAYLPRAYVALNGDRRQEPRQGGSADEMFGGGTMPVSPDRGVDVGVKTSNAPISSPVARSGVKRSEDSKDGTK